MPALVTMMAGKPTARAAAAGVFTKGKKYANIQEAAAAGLKGATAPFPEGLDALGFCNGIDGGLCSATARPSSRTVASPCSPPSDSWSVNKWKEALFCSTPR